MGKNFLVIGGSGFIGRNLIRELAKHDLNITGFSKSEPIDDYKQLEWCIGDFRDARAVAAAVKGQDVVFHLVSSSVPSTAQHDIVSDIDNNIRASVQLMDICARNNVGRVVFISSGGTVYGPGVAVPTDEESPTNPISAYGVAKLSIEKYFSMFARTRGLKSTVVRLSNPYGPNQNSGRVQGVIPIFFRKIINEEEICIWGDGTIVRDYIHVSDVNRALINICKEETDFSLYNIGSGIGYSLNEIIDIVASICKKKPIVKFAPARDFDVPSSILDITLAKRRLGWQPQISLKQGIEMTYQTIGTGLITNR